MIRRISPYTAHETQHLFRSNIPGQDHLPLLVDCVLGLRGGRGLDKRSDRFTRDRSSPHHRSRLAGKFRLPPQVSRPAEARKRG